MNASRHPHISRNAALIAAAAFGVLALSFQACDVEPPQPRGLATTLTPPTADPVTTASAPTATTLTPPTTAPIAAPAQSSVYYANCTAARAAGAAPLHRGDPGYRPPLDRDNDGIACE
ncbi:excalibur calcium-binding domain-containing protein [Nocardia sp. NPDC050406]|uniref:excalibur calcium-binding domain-containing protein n=1 Tax=Nocardia sp. NPDC050406 TaxID=3364318 RepID=UPI0037AF46E2